MSEPRVQAPTVTLRDYLLVLRRYSGLIVLLVALAGIAGWHRLRTTSPSYTATVALLVRPTSQGDEAAWTTRGFAGGGTDAKVTVQVVRPEPQEPPPLPVEAYAKLLGTRRVAGRVAQRIAANPQLRHVPHANTSIADAVRLEGVQGTTLFTLEVRLPDPALAAAAANATAEELVALDADLVHSVIASAGDLIDERLQRANDRIAALQQQARRDPHGVDDLRLRAAERIREDLLVRAEAARLAASVPRARMVIVEPAAVPTRPAPGSRSPLIVAIVAGLSCSIAAAFLLDYLRNPRSPLRSHPL